jgi:transposase-like protein
LERGEKAKEGATGKCPDLIIRNKRARDTIARFAAQGRSSREHVMSDHRHFTAEEKLAVLRRHLLDRVPIFNLCQELGLPKAVFYRWQREFFENGAAAFLDKQRSSGQTGGEEDTD